MIKYRFFYLSILRISRSLFPRFNWDWVSVIDVAKLTFYFRGLLADRIQDLFINLYKIRPYNPRILFEFNPL